MSPSQPPHRTDPSNPEETSPSVAVLPPAHMTDQSSPHDDTRPADEQHDNGGYLNRAKRGGSRTGLRGIRRKALIVALMLAVAPLGSYTQALTYPGNAGFQDRTVGWVRDNGGNDLVNVVENWYYTHNAPPTVLPQAGTIPDPATSTRTVTVAGLPTLPVHSGSSALPGEGRWVEGRRAADGRPALYTSFILPDAQHLSVVAGVAWIRQDTMAAHLVAGTRQPDTGPWPGNSAVPQEDVPHLLATFNSGFKAKDITGGFYLDGRSSRDLVSGEASVVIYNDGRVEIGAWNTDVRMTTDVKAVRQNLHLIVTNGQPESGLTVNSAGRWGSAQNQLQYTWRSGLGTDQNGNLIYVGGADMTLQNLADALVQAGAIRGLELDIHGGQVNFSSWMPQGQDPTPQKLLPSMPKTADRYLAPDQRDFFYLTVR